MTRYRSILILSLASCCLAIYLPAQDEVQPKELREILAIENVCAWPNLVHLPDGTIIAVIHNQPSHGQMEGEIECWSSANGETWTKQGNPAPHEPNTIRMNHAAGLAGNGDLVVLCSGWTNEKQPQRPKQAKFRDAVLRPWVCRSTDQGKTWTQSKEFPSPDEGWSEYVPFGPIVIGENGVLHASCYNGKFVEPTMSTRTKPHRAWHFTSSDDGRTWTRGSVIGPDHNETSLLSLGKGKWLAAVRATAVELFQSDDDGVTWKSVKPVTGRNEINGHLLQLKDGRLLLSYGNRVKDKFGVLAKISSDGGQTWGPPIRLAHTVDTDCGYPSSVQRSDGKIVTAWYARGTEQHKGYQMGVTIWGLE